MSKSENLRNFESNIPLQGRALRVCFLCEDAGQAVSGHHRGADAGFDGEDHVAFQFDVMADALAPQAVEPEDILVVRGLADDLGDEGSRAE